MGPKKAIEVPMPHYFPVEIKIANMIGKLPVYFLSKSQKLILSYYQPIHGETAQTHRKFVLCDPYDSRYRFKVTDVTTVLVHEPDCNSDPHSPAKLDVIFGKL